MVEHEAGSSTPQKQHIGYQVFILVLSIWAIAALAASAFVSEGTTGHTFLEYADLLVCVLFFIDFVVTLACAENRLQYLATWGWLDLLSSIPMLPAARLGRLARIFRVVRVIRGIRATRLVASLVLQHRAENTFLAAALVAILLTITCGAAM
jgi:voltage-gated potassium channel